MLVRVLISDDDVLTPLHVRLVLGKLMCDGVVELVVMRTRGGEGGECGMLRVDLLLGGHWSVWRGREASGVDVLCVVSGQ